MKAYNIYNKLPPVKMTSINNNIIANNDPDNYYRAVIYASMNAAYFTAAKKDAYKRRVQTARRNRATRISSTFSEGQSQFQRDMARDVQPEIVITSNNIESQQPLIIQADEVPMFPLRMAGADIYTYDDLNKMTKPMLTSILEQRNLTKTGRKDALINRILENQSQLT